MRFFFLVIDRRNNEVVERLTRDDDEEAIKAKIRKALAGTQFGQSFRFKLPGAFSRE